MYSKISKSKGPISTHTALEGNSYKPRNPYTKKVNRY